jgi:AcrR family transcriptional regulator
MPASAPKTTRRRRRNGVRGPANSEALLAAAHRLVMERGENFTTQDLIKEADVALQTFYRHFGGKDQILVAVFADLITGHCEALAERAAHLDDPVERFRYYVTDTLTMLVANPGATARFMTSQHWRLHQLFPEELAIATKPFADLVQRELEEARDAGRLTPRSPERDAWIINKLVMSVFHHYAFAADAEHAATIAEDVWQFCLAGVGGIPEEAQPVRPRRRMDRTRGAAR